MVDLKNLPDLVNLALEGTKTGIWDRDVAANQMRYSSGWAEIIGYTPDELSPRLEDAIARIHPDDADYVKTQMERHLSGQSPFYEVEHRLRCKDGTFKWVLSRGRVVSRDPDGHPLRMVGTTADITSIRELSAQLEQTASLMTNLINQVPGLVFQYRQTADGAGCFPYASAMIDDIFELSPADVAGSAAAVLERIHPEDRRHYQQSLALSATSLAPWHAEYRVLLPRQGVRWRQTDAQPLRQPDGGVLWHGLVVDATTRKHAEYELKELTRIDDLTQLANRRFFMQRLEGELNRVRRGGGQQSTVMMLDLDHFKAINDTHGHGAGDIVVKHFGNLLREQIRRHDVAGRLGGDEFGVILSGTTVQDGRIFAERLRRKITEAPVEVNGTPISLSISIGMCSIDADDADIESSLTRADEALYRAKRLGRNRIVIAGPPDVAMTG
jgi:diguanylate cyclase (GGDEF)-like protein/PAS domain S-box-containing protein